MFNHTITIFNRKRNSITGLDEYKCTILEGVHWEDISSVKLGNTSIKTDNNCKVVIPMNVKTNKKYLSPKKYAKLIGTNSNWTLQEEDVVVKGEVKIDIKEISDLDNYDDVRTIKSVSVVDYGLNSYLNNYTIEGK